MTKEKLRFWKCGRCGADMCLRKTTLIPGTCAMDKRVTPEWYEVEEPVWKKVEKEKPVREESAFTKHAMFKYQIVMRFCRLAETISKEIQESDLSPQCKSSAMEVVDSLSQSIDLHTGRQSLEIEYYRLKDRLEKQTPFELYRIKCRNRNPFTNTCISARSKCTESTCKKLGCIK